ncbi:cytochrome d ubiquinol oxidase subunit II [Algoriphagus pacificus]|uniref:Cytochrome d ubiquinol oxidase subunit II n=1 Tax=Algoriphagus pacificus TaxID=2811234 RepID=A0ABS3CJR1_9BACT|nr:cytochrome d ubiquinol oxidase subunit II [Algoriphagus pacificus]MBN7817338.1 cytochrome d ubiquinol oxidase subunit II [Algoriphagus pacificus]
MLYVVIVFLGLSISLYVLMGGADFGAGIVEMTTPAKIRDRVRAVTYQTIGPIWEANHMWLIITIVILFVGFPAIYTMLSVHLHIPLVMLLIGIIGRGTAFVFRHYDAVKDDMQRIYNLIFTYSSFVTPLFLGLIFGATVSGNINPDAANFYDSFIHPWFNFFSLSIGLFTVAICGFLAAVFLVGETKEKELKSFLIKRSRIFMVATVLAGGLVFLAAELEGIALVSLLIQEPLTLSILLLATLALVFLWFQVEKGNRKLSRALSGFVVSAILIAFGYHYFPDIIITQSGENLSVFNSAAIGKPIETLAWALLIGSLFILPSLFYLLFSFQRSKVME